MSWVQVSSVVCVLVPGVLSGLCLGSRCPQWFVSWFQMSPVVIVLVSDGQRCLLARQPSFPPGMYSALAGFCELGQCTGPLPPPEPEVT